MGDAAGIGPEIVLKAVADPSIRSVCRPIVVGDARVLRETAAKFDIPFEFSVGDAGVLDLANINSPFEVGKDAAVTGKASAEYIEKAVELWRERAIDAVATAPISKAAIHLGGYDFPGHTEFLAHLTGTNRFAMSFFAGKLRVVLLSTHLSLRDALGLVKRTNLVGLIEFANSEFSRLLGKKPRIAVAGLNPHASEGGMFGTEEELEITPAIAECRDAGIDVSGPYSPDTIFLRAHRGEFDAVIACYHDQATIPVKCLSFGASVNVTLGLPLIRTSVDHGTAYDIAGSGVADASSMIAAIKLGAELAETRKIGKLC